MLYYYEYMIRTKDFVVILIACMLATIGAGFFFISSDTTPQVIYSEGEVSFSEPRDTYTITRYVENSLSRDRDAFMDKVRQAYVPTEVEKEEIPEVIVEKTVSVVETPAPTPVEEAPPATASTSGPIATTTLPAGVPYVDPSI